MEQIFTDIYKSKHWEFNGIASGIGSTLEATESLRKDMETWPDRYGKWLFDAPCGDMHWISQLYKKFEYIGMDIVPDLVKANRDKCPDAVLVYGDICTFDISAFDIDVFLCRDCMVHLDEASIKMALKNICNSKAKILAMTHFASNREFKDIPIGKWRPINFTLEPFNLPEPMRIISENCKEVNGEYYDKCIGLWLVSEIKEAVCKL